MTLEVEILPMRYSDLEVECWPLESLSAWVKGLEWTPVRKDANRLTIRDNY